MNAIQPKDNLRIPQFHNEWVEITAFEQRKGGHQWPDVAVFRSGDWMKTAVVYLRREDWPVFKAAGYDLRGRIGEVNPPIDVLILNDYVAVVRSADGTEYTHQPREAAPVLQVVSSAAPALIPDNGEPPVPLVVVEPDATPRRRGDDGSGFTPGKARLYAKMATVMANLKAIPKRGRNKEQAYDYVTDADLYDAVRTEMAKANLALLVRMKDIRKETETKTNKYGDVREYVTTLVDLDFTLCCGDTGATETIHWTGSTLNPGDKAISAAVTVAEKYFLKATFIISTGDVADDPDNGVSDAPEPATSKRQSPPRPPKPEATKSADTGSVGNGHTPPTPAVAQTDMTAVTFTAERVKYIGGGNSAYVKFSDGEHAARLYSRDMLRELGAEFKAFAEALTPGPDAQEAVKLPAPVRVTAIEKTGSTGFSYWTVTGLAVQS